MKRRADRSHVRIGVSACLLGHGVRWDGGHKRDAFVAGPLSRLATLVPVCPEVEVGMGTPREPVRLVRIGGQVRMIGRRSGTDHTEAMRRWSEARVRELEKEGLCGFVLKRDSPSCGVDRVEVHSKGAAARRGRGLFAGALMARMPLLPVEEEDRLADPRRRESFVERALAWRRLADLFASRWRVRELVRFHAAQELLLMAHHPAAWRALGHLVAGAKRHPRAELARRYGEGYLRALARPASIAGHGRALRGAAGRLGARLPEKARRELREAIGDYLRGRVGREVPLTLLRRHLRRHRVPALRRQTYLDPLPGAPTRSRIRSSGRHRKPGALA